MRWIVRALLALPYLCAPFGRRFLAIRLLDYMGWGGVHPSMGASPPGARAAPFVQAWRPFSWENASTAAQLERGGRGGRASGHGWRCMGA